MSFRPILQKSSALCRYVGMASFALLCLGGQAAADSSVERGHYLVNLGGCNDCHTPGYFMGKPDMGRFLGGSDVGFFIPGLGSFVGPNLTPDRETGLGDWSRDEIVAALQTGVTPDGRELSPIMPWRAFANLTRQDAYAIADYLRSLPPTRHEVAGPFGPSETPTVPVMKLIDPPK
jgi:mono/diheme cytochrome c family protein